MKKSIWFALLMFSTVSLAEDPVPMVMPENGICGEFYLLVEGVSVHAIALSQDADDMRARVEEFKKTGKVSAPQKTEVEPIEGEDPYCTRYKARLKKYLEEGVTGINPATGTLQKITGEQAEEVIQGARDNVEIFCEEE